MIVGGGFGGLLAARGLRRADVDVTLIDRQNFFLFQPLAYQVATGSLSSVEIAFPLRQALRRQRNTEVVLGEATGFDLAARTVTVSDLPTGEERAIAYDVLGVAGGSRYSYFGHDDWAHLAPELKTLDGALDLRDRILLAFESAEFEADIQAQKERLTFVIVGGGPTGVELAGALREIAVNDIPEDFRHIDTKMARIILVQGGDRLLPAFPKELSERAKKDLEGMGVEVRLNTRVTNVDDDGLWIGEERLLAGTVFWAAGVQAPPIMKTLGVPLDKAGRVAVSPDLSIPGHPNVFVLGDCADVKQKDGSSVPGLAPAAIQMGQFIAKLISKEIGQSPKPPRPTFEYWDKGTMATIGKRRAVADIKGLKFGGFFAWFLWGAVHLMFLVSFRNKIAVMLNWMYQYLTHGREARLITGDAKIKLRKVLTPEQVAHRPKQTAAAESSNA